MKLKIIDRIILATMVAGTLCLIGGCLFNHFFDGIALFSGAAWGALNLLFLKYLGCGFLLKSKKIRNVLFLAAVKWPLLYVAGFFLLRTESLSKIYLMGGFSILFCMAIIFSLPEVLKTHEK